MAMDRSTKLLLQQQCPNAPWCQENPEDIASAVLKLVLDQEPFIRQWSYKWYENMQFVYGNHHLRWSRQYGVAVDVDFMQPTRRSVNAKAHTNVAKVCAEALGSLIYSNTPEWEAQAADDSTSQSNRWAKIVQAVLDAQVKVQDLHQDFRVAANSWVTFGQLAAIVDWDHSSGDVLEIPQYQKMPQNVVRTGLRPEPITGGIMDTVVPALGSDGQPLVSQEWSKVLDDDGMPVMRKVHLGRPRVTFLTPFEYRREPGVSGIHRSKWIQRFRLMDFDDWIREYGELEGKTADFGKVTPTNMSGVVQHLATMQFLRLHMVTPINDNYFRQAGYSFTDFLRRKILVIEHWDRPSTDWPTGRRVVIANGRCTHVTAPQYKTNKVGGWHPFVEAQWFSILPSSMAVGPLHDVVPKNKQLNTTDSLIATALLRNFGSHLLVKAGGGLDPAKITGTPGEIHEVADPEGAAKWLHDSNPIPAAINQIREEYKNDVYEVSGAGEALRGNRTTGASSGYAYRLAQEREERRLTPARKEWERMIGSIGEKVFACLKSNCIKLGDDVVGYIKRQATGKFTMQDVMKLIAQPMDFGIDVNVVAGSMEMKSRAQMQANYMELIQKTPLGRRLDQDAGAFDKFLKLYDAEHMRDLSSPHRERVDRENEIFADLLALGPIGKAEAMPVVWSMDDHTIHIALHAKWMIENDAEISRTPWLMEACLLHLETHRIQERELKNEVPPGTSDIVPQMQQATPPSPTPQGVVMQKQQMDAQKAQQVAGAPQGQGQQQQGKPAPQGGPKAPPGATQPAPVGSKGPPQTSTGTAAANTPTGRGQV
jgi:hypothetical protein